MKEEIHLEVWGHEKRYDHSISGKAFIIVSYIHIENRLTKRGTVLDFSNICNNAQSERTIVTSVGWAASSGRGNHGHISKHLYRPFPIRYFPLLLGLLVV